MARGEIIIFGLASALQLGAATEVSAMKASIPAKPEAHSLTGDWRVSWPEGSCVVTLSDQVAPASRGTAESWTLALSPACEASPLLTAVRTWRPASDGMDLSDAHGRTRLFLSRVGTDVYEGASPAGPVRMTRD